MEPAPSPEQDFGDAPDGVDAGYPGQTVMARFPTRLASNGARILNHGLDLLGAAVSGEADTHGINADTADDGVSGFLLGLDSAPPTAGLVFEVGVAANAPPGARHLNVLIDLNQDGAWGGAAAEGSPEWVVQNFPIGIAPGETLNAATPPFAFDGNPRLPDAAWMRVLLTRDPIAAPDWDGSGAFEFGEVEDYLLEIPAGPAPVVECPTELQLHGVFLSTFECTLTNLGSAGDMDFVFAKQTGVADQPPAPLTLEDVQPGEQRTIPGIVIKREAFAAFGINADTGVSGVGRLEGGRLTAAFRPASSTLVVTEDEGTPEAAIADERDDLFHGDPTIFPVRHDPTVDTLFWGVGRLSGGAAPSALIPGPDGVFDCDRQIEGGATVMCGSDAPHPGPHVLIWNCVAEEISTSDPDFVRTYWVMFQDGEPNNDFNALPQFANDVLGGSDLQYWIGWDGSSWTLRRTQGPQLTGMPTGAWAVIVGRCAGLFVPQDELDLSDSTAVGVSSYSGPIGDPFGLDATSDRAPGARKPLTDLNSVTQWTLPYAVLARRVDAAGPPIEVRSDDGGARLLVPESALPDGTSRDGLKVTRVPIAEFAGAFPDGGLDFAYRLEPDGLQFTRPVTIELAVAGAGGELPMLWQVSGDRLELVPDLDIVADPVTGRLTVSAQISHFSSVVGDLDGFFKLDLRNPGDQIVKKSFDVTAVLNRTGVTPGGVDGDVAFISRTVDPWQLRGMYTFVGPAAGPKRVLNAPSRSGVFGPTFTTQTNFTCKTKGNSGFNYRADITFFVESKVLGEEEQVFERSTFSNSATYRTNFFLDCVDPFPVGPITAVFVHPETIYFVEASHPKGLDLTFTWSRSAGACGSFVSGPAVPSLGTDRVDGIKGATKNSPSDLHGQGAIAIWSHPSPACAHDTTVHPGTVTVVVSDGEDSVTRTYDMGTAVGVGKTE